MEVRRLQAGDESVLAEACLVFGAEGNVDSTAFLRRSEAVVFVAEDEVGVGGWVYGHELAHPDGERTMLLYSLDVAERSRGRGVGKALVAAFVEHARSRGCTEVWTLTEDGNEAAIATYASAGGEREPDDPVMFSWAFGHRTMS